MTGPLTVTASLMTAGRVDAVLRAAMALVPAAVAATKIVLLVVTVPQARVVKANAIAVHGQALPEATFAAMIAVADVRNAASHRSHCRKSTSR